jgi:hypothetical protein
MISPDLALNAIALFGRPRRADDRKEIGVRLSMGLLWKS